MWEFHLWYLPVWALAIWIAFSCYIIRSNEFGVVERLGKAVGTIGPGFRVYLKGLYVITRYEKTSIPDEVPADLEKIVRDDKAPVNKDKGEARAMFISHLKYDQALFFHQEPTPDERRTGRPTLTWSELEKSDSVRAEAIKHDPYHQRMTSEPNGPLTWRILQEKGIDFHVNIGSKEAARSRLFDELASSLQDVCGKMTMGECIRTIDIISEHSERKLKLVVGEIEEQNGESRGLKWGIVIENFSIKQFYPGHELNKMVRDAAGAEAKRREKIANAEAEKQEKILRGEGEAAAVKAVAEVMKTPEGRVARGYDALEVAFENGNLIVAGEAIGLAKAIQQGLAVESK